MTDTNHAEEAEGRLLHWNNLVGGFDGWQIANAIEANVTASLHLADKQHMSNLIAAHAAFGSNIGSWPADIREGLGL